MGLKACLFDLGNVLVFFSHDKMCRQIGQLVGKSESEVRAILLGTPLQLDFESGRKTATEVHRELDRFFGSETELDDFERAASDIFELNEPMVPLLDELKSNGIRLVLLSNTCSSHFEFVRDNFDLLNRFDDFTTSYQAGATKPFDRIYEDALSRIQCEPGECFYTDDIPDYIDAAKRFGIDAEVFTSAERTRECLVARGMLAK